MNVNELKLKGNEALKNADFNKAIHLYTKAIEIEPNNHILFSNRSAAYGKLEKNKDSLEDAEKAISLRKDWSKGYFRKGTALELMKRFDEACIAYAEGLKLENNNNEEFVNALTNCKLKSQKKAAELEKEKGNAAYLVKDLGKALAHYMKAIELDPTSIVFMNNKAAVYFEQNEMEKCIKTCQKAIEVGRKNNAEKSQIGKAFARLGSAYYKSTDLKKALQSYESSLSEYPNEELLKKKKKLETEMKESSECSISKRLADAPHILGESELQKDCLNGQQMAQMNQLTELASNMCLSRGKGDQQTSAMLNYIDKSIPPFHTEFTDFPDACSRSECKNMLLGMYESSKARKLGYLMYLHKGTLDRIDFYKRYGTDDSEVIRWFGRAESGDVCPIESYIIYDPRVLHSFTNEVNEPKIITPGKTHVAIGFVDLGLFHVAHYSEPLSIERPLQWVGFEASAYCVAKTAVIAAMLASGAKSDCVLQVWYSAAWSRDTLKLFRQAVNNLLESKHKISAVSHAEVKSLLLHWQQCREVSLSESRKKWQDATKKTWLSISNLTQPVDRKALCAYVLTGQLLKADVGSVVMYSLPVNYRGALHLDESVFQTINLKELLKRRAKCANIVDAAIEHLRDGISSLRTCVMNKEILIDVHFQIVDLAKPDVLAAIARMDPYTISWSNICDYISSDKFHQMARKCSGFNTIHFAYSMNWPRRVNGASIIDYDGQKVAGKKYLEELLKISQYGINLMQPLIDPCNLMTSEIADDPRNIIDYGLYGVYRHNWIRWFFSKAGLDFDKQVNVEKALYNIFSRTNSTIYFTFTYDPEISLIPTIPQF